MRQNAKLAVLLLLALVTVAVGWAQQDVPPQNAPGPATQDQTSAPDTGSAATVVPDNRPLTGAQEGGLGLPANFHSNMVFRMAASETVNSNSDFLGGDSNRYNGGGNIAGNVEVSHYWRRGQIFYQGGAAYNSRRGDVFQTHSLVASQKFTGPRLSFLLSDQFRYTPAADFGAAGMEGLLGMDTLGGISGFGTLGQSARTAGVATLNSSFVPNQSVLTAPSGRINNTVVGEVEYRLNFRQSVTMTGSYGLLHAMDSDLLETRQYNAAFGYNYLVNANTTVAANYDYTRLDYSVFDRAVNSHSVGLMFGRTLLGRLRFTAGGGGQFYTIDDPGISQSDLTWNSNAGLQYSLGRLSLRADWMRSVTAGSGVLPGAETNSVTVRGERQFAGVWNLLVNAGYADNKGLGSPQGFETEYVGAGVNRRLGRHVGMFANYNLQHQKGSAACTARGCGIAFMQHVFSIGLNWISQPIGIF